MLISAGDIIKKSISLYRDNSKLFLRYMGLLFIPTAAISVMAGIMELFSGLSGGMMMLLYVVVAIIATVVAFWFSIAFIRVLATRYLGKTPGEMSVEVETAKKFIWPAILVSILTGLVVLGGMILIVIPGIIFSVWFAFTLYNVIFEDKTGFDALSASKKLVAGRWWGVLWRLIAPGILFAIIMLVLQGVVAIPMQFVVGGMTAGTIGYALAVVLMGLLTNAVSVLLTPLTTAAPTLLYLELKKTVTTDTVKK